jgi:hypothetical protein
MTRDDYQKAIDLTPVQEKAFDKLRKAVDGCRKTNILFYQCMESLGALNGNNVESVTDEGYRFLGESDPAPQEACLQYLDFPVVKTERSWLDDDHCVVLRKGK